MPSLFSRIAASARIAYRILKGEDLPFGWRLLDTTTVTLGGKLEIPPTPEQLFDAYADDLWTHACVSARARAVAAAPYLLMRRTKDGKGEVVADHPILDLMERPSSTHTWETYCQTIVMHMLLSDKGSAFVEKVRAGGRGKGKSPVAELAPLLPTKMRVIVDASSGIENFAYKPNDREQLMSPDDVMHMRLVDPRSEIRGLGPICPAWGTIGVTREANRWNQGFFARGAFPGVTLQTNAPIPPAERDRLKAEWNTSHQGTGKAHGVAVLPYGLTAAEFGLTHRDMQFRDILRMGREEAHAVWAVPPVLTGLMEFAAYATSEGQLVIFRDYVVLPMLRYLFAVHGWDLFLEFEDGADLYLEPDVEAMRLPGELDRDLARALQLFTGQIIDRDEARAIVGYKPAVVVPVVGVPPAPASAPEKPAAPDGGTSEEKGAVDDGAGGRDAVKSLHVEAMTARTKRLTWHDRVMSGAGVAVADPPVRRAEYEGTNGGNGRAHHVAKRETGNDESADDDDADGADDSEDRWPEARISTPYHLGKAQSRTVSRLEPKLAKLFHARLDAQKAAVLKLVRRRLKKVDDDDKRKAEDGDAPKEEPAPKADISEAEIVRAVSEPLSREMMDLLAEGLDDGGRQMADAMRVEFLSPEKHTQDYLSDRRTNLETVLDENTAREVRDSLRAGYDAGETERQMIERLAESGTFAASRAQRIARTEMHAATQGGRFAQQKARGIKTRTWLSAPNARPTHQAASGQQRPIDEPFEVGEASLMYPGDPDGGADYPEEVVNCRCVTTSDVPTATAADLSDLLDSLGIGEDGVQGQVARAIDAMPRGELGRVDPESVAPLKVDAGKGRDVDYEPADKPRGKGTLTVGPKAPEDDVQDGVREHLVASVTTATDARGFMNGLALQDLPDIPKDSDAWSSSERKRTVRLVRLAVTDDREGLEELVGRKLTDAEWKRYQVLSRNFWIGVGTQGPTPERR